MVRPLRHRIQGVEFFPASSPTNRGIVCSKTGRYPLQTQSDLRERQSRPCGRQTERLKHPNRRATRASRLRSMPRRLRDRRPILSEPPACNQMKGPALRPSTSATYVINVSAAEKFQRQAFAFRSQPSGRRVQQPQFRATGRIVRGARRQLSAPPPTRQISAAYAACGIVGCKSREKQMRPQYQLSARSAPPLATIAGNRTLRLTIWAECTGRFRRGREHVREL
jgi:hypothetical protein